MGVAAIDLLAWVFTLVVNIVILVLALWSVRNTRRALTPANYMICDESLTTVEQISFMPLILSIIGALVSVFVPSGGALWIVGLVWVMMIVSAFMMGHYYRPGIVAEREQTRERLDAAIRLRSDH